MLIDAPPFARETVQEILDREKLVLKAIWLTHGHWDHMGGVADFDTSELEIIGHRDDQIMFEQPGIMSTFAIPGLELKPVEITDGWSMARNWICGVGKSKFAIAWDIVQEMLFSG